MTLKHIPHREGKTGKPQFDGTHLVIFTEAMTTESKDSCSPLTGVLEGDEEACGEGAGGDAATAPPTDDISSVLVLSVLTCLTAGLADLALVRTRAQKQSK